jgi:hypothetical protein
VSYLAQAGYEATQTKIVPIDDCPEGANCFRYQGLLQDAGGLAYEYLRLLDISLLRAAPLQAKHWVFSDGAWTVRRRSSLYGIQSQAVRNHRFLSLFASELFVSGDQPTVKVLHLVSTHPPIQIDGDCEPVRDPPPFTRETQAMPTRCEVETLLQLFNRLRDLNAYDNTVIAVVADHGAGFVPDDASVDDSLVAKWNEMAGYAMPMFLIKQVGEYGPLRTSEAPAHLGDLGATVCKDLGDCRSLAGVPVDELPASRQRVYVDYRWANAMWRESEIPNTKRFSINGPVWQLSSWSRVRPPVLELDTNVPFQKAFPDHASYFDWGWSILEDWGTWSDGHVSSLSFSLPAPPLEPLELLIDIQAYVTPATPTLSVSASANGTAFSRRQFEFPEKLAVLQGVIQPDAWTPDGQMTIQMEFAREVPIGRLGNKDTRLLGVGIKSLRLQRLR